MAERLAVHQLVLPGGLSGHRSGYGSKLSHQGTAGFSQCLHLPGFHFGYLFSTHGHLMQFNLRSLCTF